MKATLQLLIPRSHSVSRRLNQRQYHLLHHLISPIKHHQERGRFVQWTNTDVGNYLPKGSPKEGSGTFIELGVGQREGGRNKSGKVLSIELERRKSVF
jgi:hypothetical protein